MVPDADIVALWEEDSKPPLTWLDMSGWDNEPIPEREWAIPDRVPLKQAGLCGCPAEAGCRLRAELKA